MLCLYVCIIFGFTAQIGCCKNNIIHGAKEKRRLKRQINLKTHLFVAWISIALFLCLVFLCLRQQNRSKAHKPSPDCEIAIASVCKFVHANERLGIKAIKCRQRLISIEDYCLWSFDLSLWSSISFMSRWARLLLHSVVEFFFFFLLSFSHPFPLSVKLQWINRLVEINFHANFHTWNGTELQISYGYIGSALKPNTTWHCPLKRTHKVREK